MAAKKKADKTGDKPAKAPKETGKKAGKELPAEQTIRWNLADLPTSQHRAGLAGLVLMVRWLNKQESHKGKGTCELVKVDSHGATLRFDVPGFQSLVDHAYQASEEEVEREQPLKDKNKAVIPPLREETRSVTDAKGKSKTKTFYVYPQVVPGGACVLEWEPDSAGNKAVWIKMWRDLLWSVLRGVPAQRLPYQQRAEGLPVSDGPGLYEDLVDDPTVELPSTYYLGAQAKTAEDVGFKDKARRQFVLHFWPFAMRIYIPSIITREGKEEFSGFAVAFPDVHDLSTFCDLFPQLMMSRSSDLAGYRPRDAKVDLAIEAGVDVLWRLRTMATQLQHTQGQISFAVRGIDVIHIGKQGNNVRVWSSSRVEPEAGVLDDYGAFRGAFWNPDFRRQRLINLIHQVPWHTGFLRLFKTAPMERFFGTKSTFRHDSREAFKALSGTEEHVEDSTKEEKTLEQVIYRVVQSYLMQKLKTKYGLQWDKAKGNPQQEGEYSEKKQKLSQDAFLGCRSRSGADFQEYFTSKLCSVPQHVGEAGYRTLSTELLKDPERVRTLTMLALSAQA